MKIGIVSPYYLHRPGGVQVLVCGLADYLHAKGHDVVVIAPRPRKDQDLPTAPYQMELIGSSAEIKFRAPFHTTSPLAASSKKEIEALLARHEFDVINVHEPWMPMLPYQITMNADVPIVGTLHARWPRTAINLSLIHI